MFAEIARQEEVAVLLVVGHVQLEGCGLRATFRRHALAGRIFLRDDGLQLQFAKLHVRTDTKQAAGTLHQRVVRGEGDVTGLDQLDDLVFLAFIAQLDVLCVEVEGGVGIVVQRHVHLVAHLTRHVQVDLLVEVDGFGITVGLRQRWVVDALQRTTQLQFGGSLRLDAHTTRTEYLLGRSQVEVHIGKVEFLLAFIGYILCVFLAEEALHLAFLAPRMVFLRGHQYGGIQIRVTYLRANHVHARRVVILHLLTDILREAQVDDRRVQVGHLHRCYLLYAPARVQKRVRDGIFLYFDDRLLLGRNLPSRLGILRRRGQCRHAQQDYCKIEQPLPSHFLFDLF